MKKSKYFLLGLVFISFIAFNPSVKAQYPTYQVAASVGGEKILEVTTVNSTVLYSLMGPSWITSLETSFGSGCYQLGAKNKARITNVYDNETVNLGLGPMNAFIVETDVWEWITLDFPDTPHQTGINVTTLYDPKDLQALCAIGYWLPGPIFVPGGNVSMYAIWWDGYIFDHRAAANYLTQLPVPAASYLAAMNWSAGFTVSGLSVSLAGTPDGFVFFDDYTATWTYDSVYGAFLGYELKDSSDRVVYEFEIFLPSEIPIPGYELPILFGITGLAVVCLLYIVKKKK